MDERTFLGARYADALPSGAFVAEYPGQSFVDTHIGRIPLPDGVSTFLFPAITDVGGFKMAGQFGVLYTPEWIGGVWQRVMKTAHGINCVIYDAAGELHVATSVIGAQGWRYREYVTGRLVTGDEANYKHGLNEPIDLGDGLWIGQGGDGIQAWDGAHHRQGPRGTTKAIRAHREGSDVAMAWWQQDEKMAVCRWTTMDEIRAWDRVTAAPPIALLLPPTCLPHWTAMDGWDGTTGNDMPGNLGWSAPAGDLRPAYEGLPWAEDIERLHFLHLGIHGGKLPTDAQVKEAVEHRNSRTPDPILSLYSDEATWNTAKMKTLAARVRKYTSRHGRELQCYPKHGFTTDQRIRLLKDEIAKARRAKKRIVITSAAYEVVPGRPDLTESLALKIARLIEDHLAAPKPILNAHIVFGARRVGQGLPRVEDFYRRHWSRMKKTPAFPRY